MNFDSKTLAKRKPLWIALSDLFLDTELQEYTLAFIAKEMKKSAYSLDEIEGILMLEVFPVCIPNLHSVAGQWAGFNEGWLIQTITTIKRPNRFKQWKNRRSYWMIKDEWEAVVKLFEAM